MVGHLLHLSQQLVGRPSKGYGDQSLLRTYNSAHLGSMEKEGEIAANDTAASTGYNLRAPT